MSIKSLQKKIGVVADGVFGPATLKAATNHFALTPEQAAHFFGQTAHESGNFRFFTENLNYSAGALRKVFSKYFPTATEAEAYERQPEKIANLVYANRMNNGNEASGDGWKYRGRGALQLTGKANYQAFADYVNDQSIMLDPDQVADTYAFDSALFFFESNRLWTLCVTVDEEAITKLTRRINGGTNGLQDRIEKTHRYYSMLN